MTPTHAGLHLLARNLECVRAERRVFGGVDFDLENGGLLQVRGPNGSGKTSLLRMVCGLLPAAAGEIAWNGVRARDAGEAFRACITYVGHLNGVKEELTSLENLRIAARLAGLQFDEDSVRAALRAFGLDPFAHLPCKVLSQGQKRRLALARLMLSRARALWVLDEPFSALDTDGIAAMGTLLEDHLAHGGLVLLTTHQDAPISAPTMQNLQLGA